MFPLQGRVGSCFIIYNMHETLMNSATSPFPGVHCMWEHVRDDCALAYGEIGIDIWYFQKLIFTPCAFHKCGGKRPACTSDSLYRNLMRLKPEFVITVLY